MLFPVNGNRLASEDLRGPVLPKIPTTTDQTGTSRNPPQTKRVGAGHGVATRHVDFDPAAGLIASLRAESRPRQRFGADLVERMLEAGAPLIAATRRARRLNTGPIDGSVAGVQARETRPNRLIEWESNRMGIEREAKLATGPDVVLPDLQDVLDGVAVGPTSIRHLEAVYFDTADLALARSGVTVRSRTGEPGPTWTVKLPDGGRESLLARREVTFEGPLGHVPPGALDLVMAYRRTQALEPVAVVRTTRTQFALSDETGPVATVCDDTVSAEAGAAEPIAFREVEIELGEGSTDDHLLDAVVDRFRDAGCRFEKRTVAKVIRALGEAAQAPPDVVVADIGRKASVGEVVAAAFARSVQQVIRLDPRVRLGDDPEDLHQFRVATRRLRSDLRTFGPLLDATWRRR